MNVELPSIRHDESFPFVVVRDDPSKGSVILRRVETLRAAASVASYEVLCQNYFEDQLHVVRTTPTGSAVLVA